MADSQYWRDMEARFRALPDPFVFLRADWHYIVGSGGPGEWRLCGGATASVHMRFEALAKQAGFHAKNPVSCDPLVCWLDLLRLESPNFDLHPYGAMALDADGQVVAHLSSGSIFRLCEASADLCAKLEGREFALQTERLRAEAVSTRAATPTATGTDLAQSSQANGADAGNSNSGDRRAAVDAFILKCKQGTSMRVIRTHIWKAVGHSSARQFQYWQASDPKATALDDQNFHRILAMSPTDFEALLKKRGII